MSCAVQGSQNCEPHYCPPTADVLGTLCALTSHANLAPNAAEMFNNIVLRWRFLPPPARLPLLLLPLSRQLQGVGAGVTQLLQQQLLMPCPSMQLHCPVFARRSTMSAAFCAFNLSPLALPLQQTDVVVQVGAVVQQTQRCSLLRALVPAVLLLQRAAGPGPCCPWCSSLLMPLA